MWIVNYPKMNKTKNIEIIFYTKKLVRVLNNISHSLEKFINLTSDMKRSEVYSGLMLTNNQTKRGRESNKMFNFKYIVVKSTIRNLKDDILKNGVAVVENILTAKECKNVIDSANKWLNENPIDDIAKINMNNTKSWINISLGHYHILNRMTI
jgi:hypothetical protein